MWSVSVLVLCMAQPLIGPQPGVVNPQQKTIIQAVVPDDGTALPSTGRVYVEVDGDRLEAEIREGLTVWAVTPEPVLGRCGPSCVFSVDVGAELLGPAEREVELWLLTPDDTRAFTYRVNAVLDDERPSAPEAVSVTFTDASRQDLAGTDLVSGARAEVRHSAPTDDTVAAAVVISGAAEGATLAPATVQLWRDCAPCTTTVFIETGGASRACVRTRSLDIAGKDSLDGDVVCGDVAAAGCAQGGAAREPSLWALFGVLFLRRRRF